MQYFFKSNSEVEYIKNLVRANYIPTVRFFSTEVNMQPVGQTTKIEGFTSAGTSVSTLSDVSDIPNVEAFVGESAILNNNVVVGEDDGTNGITTTKFRYVNPYVFGKRYKNITTNYISNKNYYDSALHEYLGRYLRAFRDYYRVDVMNFYNCFSNRFITSFSLPFNGYSNLLDYDDKYKLTAFPIQYDTEYEITFSAGVEGEVTLQAVYFNGTVPIAPAETTVDSSSGEETAISYKVTAVKKIRVVIGSSSEKSKLMKQNLLYLYMQYPANMQGHITVLEQPKFTVALNNELLSRSSLLSQEVAFSDTLLEYITGNAICPAMEVSQSIAEVQSIIFNDKFYEKFGVGGSDYVGAEILNYKPMPGVFDEGMHRIIYNAFFDYDTNTRQKLSAKLTSAKTGEVSCYTLLDWYNKLAGKSTEESEDESEDGTTEEGVTEEKKNGQTISYSLFPNFIGYVDKNVEPVLEYYRNLWNIE